MKKAIASGLVGLIALGGSASVAMPPASAQEVEESTSRQERQEARREARMQRRAEAISSALGLSVDEFQAAQDAGQSVAEIAGDQGVTLEEVHDSLAGQAQARLDEKVADGTIDEDRAADIRERMADRAERRDQRRDARQERREERQATRSATLSDVLGLSAEELAAAREGGQNLAAIAEVQGVPVQSIIDALMADVQVQFDALVADGTMDADLAAERLAKIEARLTERLNG